MSVSKDFTAVGAGNAMNLQPGQSADYELSGTFAATVVLEVGQPGMFWNQVTSGTAAYSGNYKNDSGSPVSLRFRCSARVSGTAETTLTEADDTVLEVKDRSGNVVATITDDGFPAGAEVSAPDGEILFGNSGGDGVTSDPAFLFDATTKSLGMAPELGTMSGSSTVNPAPIVNDGATIGDLAAVSANPYMAASTVTYFRGILTGPYIDAGGTVTQALGIDINLGGDPTATIPLAVGLFIRDVDCGDASYAIKTADGLVDLGDDTTVHGDFVATGDVKGATFHVGAAAGIDGSIVTDAGTFTVSKGIITVFTPA